MSGIFKRSKNLATAQLASAGQNDPSPIESIHQMKDKLVTKKASMEALYAKTEARARNHASLIGEWGTRSKAAEDMLATLQENSYQHKDMEHLLALAKKYHDIHFEGKHEADKALAALRENLKKIHETILELQSVENRHALNSSLMRASESMGETKVLYTAQEAEEMSRIAYSAKALISLKESDLVMPEIATNAESIKMENEFKKLEGA